MEELPSSELGTKDHWDKTYRNELEMFNDIGDIGEVWFGEDSEERVIDWLTSYIEDRSDMDLTRTSVIDLGCGNGHLLVQLGHQGFTQLYGVDYSLDAVNLARAVSKKADVKITYGQADILSDVNCDDDALLVKQYGVCHDKGTYDAISLTPETAATDKIKYLNTVTRLLEDDGIFVITSCNWTEDELISQFKNYFTKIKTIPTPTFMFGGKTGSLVTSVVFKKLISDSS